MNSGFTWKDASEFSNGFASGEKVLAQLLNGNVRLFIGQPNGSLLNKWREGVLRADEILRFTTPDPFQPYE